MTAGTDGWLPAGRARLGLLVAWGCWWTPGALDLHEVSWATPTPVVIHAPNVASDAIKASSATRRYLDASTQRDSVFENAKEAKSKAPATYPGHLHKVIVAQNSTLQALDDLVKLQAKAVETTQGELEAVKAEYQQKAQELDTGRLGADFQSEAEDLKMRMAES
uniref:Uncharacterized protein n=1 Tax=Pyrodinium bahamense TaxID=73915 RepID=A0A7R9ZYP1_9DINO|mmetsp:Transcript_15527/g.42902  ORF Transcript_15527/g.42902 Transcript_15527/m.42902 type:complete len:164 (+) Transcript_15527:56-547(+)|eukprot:CAMPEP_0179101230 /NCGR_PEP_ID=MMETSP0796-20121207/46794_1 /TAXON_ID=73915 /ORGANISM="Pyrodinium bahamense, Strain pbaha01" /LENGTH=163 /DNA_ID=CAMNT_0020799077 /DNA_START=53 /DNA_END=544 /DNA_ORIENTATION=-